MPPQKSKVVLVRSAKTLDAKGAVQPTAVKSLLERGLQLYGNVAPEKVLGRIFHERDRVGIKVNCLARRVAISQPETTAAVIDLLTAMGVQPDRITIWERTTNELRKAGYTPNAFQSGPRCLGTDAQNAGYSQKLYPIGSIGSLVSNILLAVDININLPVLKDHSLAGLGGGMKNYYGAIHNPNKYHDNHCSPHVAEVCALPEIRQKNQLTIMDCLNVQYHGGPAHNPGFVERYGGLIIGEDPVAVDFVALSVLEKIREKHRKKPLRREGRHPEWIAAAAGEKYKLGNASWDTIELIKKDV